MKILELLFCEIGFWFACGAAGYFLFRASVLKESPPWTLSDKEKTLTLSLLGPIWLVLAVILCFSKQVDRSRATQQG